MPTPPLTPNHVVPAFAVAATSISSAMLRTTFLTFMEPPIRDSRPRRAGGTASERIIGTGFAGLSFSEGPRAHGLTFWESGGYEPAGPGWFRSSRFRRGSRPAVPAAPNGPRTRRKVVVDSERDAEPMRQPLA